MDTFIEQAITQAGSHMGRVIKLLYDGVAFRQDGRTFNVFSHEGDELGQLSTNDVSYAISFMKNMGRPVGKCKHPTFQHGEPGHLEPAFTFAWQGWHPLGI